MDLLTCLMEIGLTRHEAQLYLLLSSEGVMSGYEAAKQSGVSRSNAYLALAGLAEKGAAVQIDGPVRRYAAIDSAEFCRRKLRRCQEVTRCIEQQMPVQKEAAEPFLTIKGKENIVSKMKDMISQAQKRIYLALAPAEVELVLPEIKQALGRGLKVVLISSLQLDLTGITLYLSAKKSGQIRLIADSENVLTGTISEQDESSCLLSRHQALVTLFKEAMINEIQLIESGQLMQSQAQQ